jgi:molecular chaperone DnaK (HSP70)
MRSARPPRTRAAWPGLEVLRLVNEPTAAALAYGLDRAKAGTIAVYDFGGGTFDISILKLRDGIFEVQSTNGDTHLGGDDIDNLLLAIALDEIHAEHGVDLRGHPGAVQALRKAAIDAKIKLSTEPAAHFDIELPNGDRYQREIPRAVFELLIEPVLERTAGPCKQASPTPASRRSRSTKWCWWAARRAFPRCANWWTISSI